MKNLDFFDSLESVNAICQFTSLPSSYFWNTRTMWLYCYSVVDAGYGDFNLCVYKQVDSRLFHIYTVFISVGRFIRVDNVLYSEKFISSMKFPHKKGNRLL